MKQFPSSPPTTGWVEYTAIYPSTRLFSAVEKGPVYKGTETILNENRPTERAELSFLTDLCSKIKHWYKAHDQDFLTEYIPTPDQLELAYHLPEQSRN